MNINHFIKAPKLFVIDENGEAIGELTKEEALRNALEKELDLIEVSPKADPPVAKIMSWSKYKYELDKKRKEQKKNKSAEMKEMWFKAFIQEGDLEHKLKRVREFLQKKHPVKLQVRAKGRVNKDQMQNLIKKIIEKLSDISEIDQGIKKEKFSISVIVRPKR